MHEASLVKALLRQVEDLLRSHGAARASQIHVTVGEFSGAEPDLLEIAFRRQSPETPARGARLQVRRTELEGCCGDCSNKFRIEHFRFTCPVCASSVVTVTGGEELVLESVTMETDE